MAAQTRTVTQPEDDVSTARRSSTASTPGRRAAIETYPVTPGSVAPVGNRVLAYALDVVITLAAVAIGVVVATSVAAPGSSTTLLLPALFGLVVVLVQWVAEALSGVTLGNAVTGIRTVSALTGRPAGPVPILVRHLVIAAGALVLLVGQWVVVASGAWDRSPAQRGWHDKAAGTLVLRAEAVRRGSGPASGAAWDTAVARVVGQEQPGRDRLPVPPRTDGGRQWAGASAADSTGVGGAPAPAVAPAAAPAAAHRTAPAGAPAAAPAPAPRTAPTPWTTAPAPAPAAAPAAWTVPPRGTAPAPAPETAPVTAHVAAPETTPVIDGPPGMTVEARATPRAPEVIDVPRRTRRHREPAPGPARRRGLHLRFDTGEDLQVTGDGLVGRRPTGEGGTVHVVAIDDPDRSISRVHLAFGPEQDGTRLWVTDRGSTNGTVLVGPDGARATLPAGTRAVVQAGWTVHFGRRSFEVLDG